MPELKTKQSIKISLATDEDIKNTSYGKITKPETINYKTLKPERGGLFDERVFGPTKNFECFCGKYKKIDNKGKKCERCNVEITESIVRRERMGHIELEDPVAHIWMLKTSPSRISLMLNMKTKEIEEVVYFVSYIVIDPGTSKILKKKMILDLGGTKNSTNTRQKLKKIINEILSNKLKVDTFAYNRAKDMLSDLEDSSLPFSMEEYTQFISKYTNAKFGIGAEAIETLLREIDLEKEILNNKKKLKNIHTQNEQIKLVKRLEVLYSFYKSNSRPESMIVRNIQVIPPDIRPIIQLDGGRFTTSEINDLYRRIIIRNERLKKIKEMGAPSVIVNNEKRMLQEAVDALFDNERKARPVIGKDKRPLKSLTAILKGKQGRFRQNLLGKRVDYSGRSVIAIGPTLKMYQCGLPRDMAIVLFKPFIIRDLVKKNIAQNIKAAEKLILNREECVWEVLEEVIKERPVLLNRAPTLHRLGIQAFESKLVKGKAIRLHPLVTTAFNADFDGDQMAIHLPITPEAVAEARTLMLGSKNILGPKDGKPIVTPTQDMILGNYYLTREKKNGFGEGMIFKDINEVKIALDNKKVEISSLIVIPVNSFNNKEFSEKEKKGYLITTVGKIIFNEIFTDVFPYLHSPDLLSKSNIIIYDISKIPEVIEKYKLLEPFKSKDLSNIIVSFFKRYGSHKTAKMLDNIKDLGFKYSTISGVTIAASDIKTYDEKFKLFKEADNKVEKINEYYNDGLLTTKEKHMRIIKIWANVKEHIQSELNDVLKYDKTNPIFMMSDSGARGNISNFTQLVGMRGLMNNPKGEIIELPIKSSFREGLTMSEFFISTHGARKGMADIALKTADSGYLTRRLVDVSQEVIVIGEDCGTKKGYSISEIKDTRYESTIVPLKDRLLGRYLLKDLDLGNEIIKNDILLSEEEVDKIIKKNIKKVIIRSVLTCENTKGVCVKCYGINLATGEKVEIGEAVGVIAAQSIGEPGTQLTMRTFHTGGVAGGADITQGLPRIKELLDVTTPKGSIADIAEIGGEIIEIKEEGNFYDISIKNNVETVVKRTHFNAILRVKKGDVVKPGDKLTEGSIDIKKLLTFGRIEDVQNYILKEIQKVYRLQGIEISNKYIEIIIKQMLSKVYVIDPGDSDLLQSQIISRREFNEIVRDILEKGKEPPNCDPIILGIKKAPLESSSFLSSASFQDTTRVLVKAIIKGRVDPLEGLKENIMLGNLIPAGTGLKTSEEVILMGENAKKFEY